MYVSYSILRLAESAKIRNVFCLPRFNYLCPLHPAATPVFLQSRQKDRHKMNLKKTLKTVLSCMVLGCLFCACKSHYYLPGGNGRRTAPKDCGCPSFSQAAPSHLPGVWNKTLYLHQPMHMELMPIAYMANNNKGR